ncbi:hypothetical protein BJX64DRAFT_271469 [Aspergillus heterothallicus]
MLSFHRCYSSIVLYGERGDKPNASLQSRRHTYLSLLLVVLPIYHLCSRQQQILSWFSNGLNPPCCSLSTGPLKSIIHSH